MVASVDLAQAGSDEASSQRTRSGALLRGEVPTTSMRRRPAADMLGPRSSLQRRGFPCAMPWPAPLPDRPRAACAGADAVDARQDQAERLDDARLPRVVDPVLVPRRRREAGRLRLRDLREDRRQRQEGDRPRRHAEAVPGGHVGQPHPAAAERHDRHRVRLDDQQLRARQAGRSSRPTTSTPARASS